MGTDPCAAVWRALAGVPYLGPGDAQSGPALRDRVLLFESVLRLRFDLWADIVSHMFLPALALAIPLAAIIGQLLKQSLKETMHLDYVTLRGQGLWREHVILREALRNAVLPTLTLVGVQFTFLIGGTVIIERLFSYEGLGNLAIDAVINRDLPLIQGIVILFAVIFVAVNLCVDLLYAVLTRGCGMVDARGMVRRRAGLRLWLAAGWLLFVASLALLAPWSRRRTRWRRTCSLGGCRRSGWQGQSRAIGWGPTVWGRDVLSRMIHGARVALGGGAGGGGADGGDRGEPGPAGGVPARLGGHGDFPVHRHLDGLPSGAVFHPSDRRPWPRPDLDHHCHRGHRLDAVRARGAG